MVAGAGEGRDQLRHATIEDGLVLAAGLMGDASDERLSGSRWPAQEVALADPVAGGEAWSAMPSGRARSKTIAAASRSIGVVEAELVDVPRCWASAMPLPSSGVDIGLSQGHGDASPSSLP